MKIIGIIPARGGSKGIKDKNIKQVAGKPLVQYTIEAALQSTLLNEIWLSSDSDKILDTARNFTTIRTHKRSMQLATDQASVTGVITEVLASVGTNFDIIVLLQPTAPIRTGVHIDEAIKLLVEEDEANSIISVCEMHDVHPARMYWSKKHLHPIMTEYEESRRQDIPPVYYRNGSLYIVRVNAFREENSMMIKPILPYIMPLSLLLNIDEKQDVIIAESLIPAWQKGLLG